MFARLGQIIVSAAGSMVIQFMTEDFFKWLFVWASEKAVKKTAWKWDDELHKKVKDTIEEKK